jgi:succinate dehydrogenase / fumarate reductase flavoprotein subunit
MTQDSTEWNVITSEVLIVGGGYGGLWSAIKAAEGGCSVTLVDKSFAGKSGHSCFASGARMALLPGDDLDPYISDIVLGNEWLVDQQMVEAVFEGSYERLKDVESLGINFRKEKGEYIWTKARGTKQVKNLWPENATASDEVMLLRKVAIQRGVQFIDHVYVYGLAKDQEDHVAGALGLGVRDSRDYLFKAKNTVLATNTGGYKGHHLASDLQGTGPFMAYDAGARIKNPEFHYINIRPSKHEIEGSGILPAMGGRWVNARGEYYMENYESILKDRAPVYQIVLASAKEAMKGQAPISIDVRSMSEAEREKFRLLMVSHGWQPILFEKCKTEEGYDILRDNIEWQPAYESNKLGIDTTLDGRTSLDGLFAAGMARTLGINPFTGWSIASCTWSGFMAGRSACEYARQSDFKKIDASSLTGQRMKFYEPGKRVSGVEPDRLIRELQEVLFPVDVLIIMAGPRLRKALDRVLHLKEEELPVLKAPDVRSLIRAREAQTMVLSAEMTLRASLMREETRQSIFCREDHHALDNENWLKWIVVQKGRGGEMEFNTEEIPFDQYRFSPPTSSQSPEKKADPY